MESTDAPPPVLSPPHAQQRFELLQEKLIPLWRSIEVLNQDPDFVRAYEELAHLYVRRDLVDGAVAALEVGLQHQADDPVLLNDLGVCKLLQKDPAAAAQAFIRAAALEPDNARPRANLALALALQGRDDEALALWQQVIRPSEAAQNLELVKQAR